VNEVLSITSVEASAPDEPVTVDEVKEWANIDHTDDDALLFTMIIGARQDVEAETGIKLVPNTVTVVVKAMCDERLYLPYVPLITEATPLSVADDLTDAEIDADGYKVKGGGIQLFAAGTYAVTYTTGGTTQALNELIKMLVAYRYNNRGDGESGMPDEIKQRLLKYQKVWL